MSYIGTFKLLLLIQVILSLITPVVGYYGTMNLPKVVDEYLTQQSEHSLIIQLLLAIPTTLLIALGISFIVLLVVNLIGLWLLHNWARHLYVFITIVGFIFLALDLKTPFIASGSESYLLDMLNVLTGATIAMMYLPPLAGNFKASSRRTPS